MEGRQKERESLFYFLRVRDSSSGDLLGYLWNASTEGLSLMSEGPLPVGRQYELTLEHPRGGDQVVQFSARTQWSKRDSESDFYRTGLQLLPSQEEAVATISAILEEYKYVEPPDETAPDGG